MEETNYFIIKKVNSDSYGIFIDNSGSIYLGDIDRAKRFEDLETAQNVRNNLQAISNCLKNESDFEVIKESRNTVEEGVPNESTTV